MRRYIRHIWNSFRKGDMILLMLCLAMTSFGMLVISSTTNAVGYSRYLSRPADSSSTSSISC